jgi:hypothetical protein
MTLRGMRQPVQDASDRLLAVLADAMGDPAAVQRRSSQAVLEQQDRLRQEFAAATELGRYRSRILAQGQVAGELAAIQGTLEQIGSEQRVPLALPAQDSPELALEDAAESQVAADSMSAAWGAAALAALMLWRRKGARARKLAPAVRRLPLTLQGRLRRHAATQAVAAYEVGRDAAWPLSRAPRLPPGWPDDWKRALRLDTAKALRLPVLEPVESTTVTPETEIGLPHGWQAGVFQVWSAVLDSKTCPVCFGLDGTMVPKGKQFPGGHSPPVHNFCRCVVVSAFIPESLRARLPGMQIDYQQLKADVAEYFQGAGPEIMGKRQAGAFIRDTMQSTGSPETLTRRFMRRDDRLEQRYRLRPEPVLRQIPLRPE